MASDMPCVMCTTMHMYELRVSRLMMGWTGSHRTSLASEETVEM